MKKLHLVLFITIASQALGQKVDFRLLFLETKPFPVVLARPIGDVKFTKMLGSNQYAQNLIEDSREYIISKNWDDALLKINEALRVEPEFWVSYFYLGIIHENTNKLSWAMEDYERAVKLAPNQPDCHLALGNCNQRIGYYSKAVFEYDKAIQLDPRIIQAYFNLGTITLVRGEEKRAIRYYEKCIELDPTLPDSYCGKALALYKLKNNQEAVATLGKCTELDPTYSPAYFWKGWLLREADDDQGALENWNMALRLDPGSQFLHIVRGFMLMKLNKFDDAFHDLQQSFLAGEVKRYLGARTLFDKHIDLKSLARYLIRHRGEFDAATFQQLEKSYCELVLGLNAVALKSVQEIVEPSSASSFLQGFILERQNKVDSAYRYFDLAVQLDPDNFDAYKKRGLYRANVNDFDGAYADFNEMARLQPDSYFIYRLRGTIRLAQADYKNSVTDFDTYLKYDPNDLDVLNLRAQAKRLDGDYVGSNVDFELILQLEPGAFSVFPLMSKNSLALLDTRSAVIYMKKYCASTPYRAMIRNSKQYINAHEEMAKLYIHLGDWGNADKQIDSIKLILWSPTPNNRIEYSIVHKLRGLLSSGQKDYKTAVRHFETSVDKDPTNYELKYLLATAYENAGHMRKAMETFKEISAYNDAEVRYQKLLSHSKKKG